MEAVKFTSASKPKTNTAKTVKANASKSKEVQFVDANIPKANKKSEKNTTSNNSFKNMITQTSNQTKPKTQTKPSIPTKTNSAITTGTKKVYTSQGSTPTKTESPKTESPKKGSPKKTESSKKTDSSTKTSSSTGTSSPKKTDSSAKTESSTGTSAATKLSSSNEQSSSSKPDVSIKKGLSTSATGSSKKLNYTVEFVFPKGNITPTTPTENVSPTQASTLENMLKEKYPNLKYHVFDASSSYWRTRNDYPHYLLYQDNIDTKALENWKPSGENPFYGSIDGVFTAPKEIKALSSVPVGTTAVVIHPKVQERMEKDPEYAKEIYDRITTWFKFDNLRNEAIMPGITARSSQCVAIGENGEIVNAQSHSSGGFSSSQSSTGTDMALDFWTERSLRHKYFMQLQLEGQLRHEMLLYGLTGTPKSSGLFDLAGGTLSAANLSGLMKLSQSYDIPTLSTQQLSEKAAAKAKLSAMLYNGELNILGSSVASMPLDQLIITVKQEIAKI